MYDSDLYKYGTPDKAKLNIPIPITTKIPMKSIIMYYLRSKDKETIISNGYWIA